MKYLTALSWIALGFVHLAAAAPVQNVLVVGDSHLGGIFGKHLDQLLRTKYQRVATYSFGGSIPDWYLDGTRSPWGSSMRGWDGIEVLSDKAETPKLADLIQHYHPDLVVIALGTNFLRTGNPETSSVALSEKVTRAGINCAWIGPPNEGEKYQQRIARFDQALESALAKTPCKYLSSFPYTEYPEPLGDGIHYDSAGEVGIKKGIDWATGIFDELRSIFKK